MWNRPLERKRLVSLRQKALEAFDGQLPLEGNIKIRLKIYIAENKPFIGDLDTFLTGICDGLMRIAPRSKLEGDFWSQPEYIDIHPEKFAVIKDDGEVISIQGEKIIGETKQHRYEITIEDQSKIKTENRKWVEELFDAEEKFGTRLKHEKRE